MVHLSGKMENNVWVAARHDADQVRYLNVIAQEDESARDQYVATERMFEIGNGSGA
jgi:hypothetical protein